MNLAPVILFVYNRPLHTKQVLDALSLNKEAKESTLYIYCDGPKAGAKEDAAKKINEVRALVKKEKRFKEVVVKEQNKNKGLANSVIDGITEIIDKHGRIIVLEDDLVPSVGFLKYMNGALEMYQHEEKVSAIHGWSRDLGVKITGEQTFFIKGADCWGWATWLRNWKLFNYDAKDLYKKIMEKDLSDYFNLFGSINYTGMLQDQINSKIDSWAIRWQASMFLENKLCLHPVYSLVKNIGTDGSGIHSGTYSLNEKIVDYIELKKIPVEENIGFYFALQSVIKNEGATLNNNPNSKVTFKQLLHYSKRFLLNT